MRSFILKKGAGHGENKQFFENGERKKEVTAYMLKISHGTSEVRPQRFGVREHGRGEV